MPITTTQLTGNRNRIRDLMQDFANDELQFQLRNPVAAAGDHSAISLRLSYYQHLRRFFQKEASLEERVTLIYLRKEISRLKTKLHPTLLGRLLNHPVLSRPIDFLLGQDRVVQSHRKWEVHQARQQTQDFNVAKLAAAFREQGFTQKMEGPLKRLVTLGQDKLAIRYFDIKHPDTDFILHCNKVPGTGLYHFECFQAISRPSFEQFARGQAESIRQTFTIHDKLNVSAAEAANLVNKRPVCKQGNEWILIDLAQQNENASLTRKIFDLTKANAALPTIIRDRIQASKEIQKHLRKGNIVPLIINQYPESRKLQLVADPMNNTIQVMDARGAPVNKHDLSEKGSQEKIKKAGTILEKTQQDAYKPRQKRNADMDNNITVDLEPTLHRMR